MDTEIPPGAPLVSWTDAQLIDWIKAYGHGRSGERRARLYGGAGGEPNAFSVDLMDPARTVRRYYDETPENLW